MGNMFTNYENINPNYTPCNTKPINPEKEKLQPCRPNKPYYEEYDAEGNLVGYYWYYGDTVNLEFKISEEDKITIIDSEYYISASEYLQDKKLVVTLYDFRKTVMARQELVGSENIVFAIDEELSKKLVKGVYTCTLILYTADNKYIDTLFSDENGVLIVK